jgi:RHS repeat-associated protein
MGRVGNWITENFTYNNLLQVTNMTAIGLTTVMNMTYNYSGTANNGRVANSVDAVTGENVSYTYDALNRLTNASASGMWSEAYSYDGFGNLTQKSGTGGTPNVAPSMTASFDANNHQVGVTYDLNGNPAGDSTTNNTWDVENRLVARTSKTAPYGGVWYAYDPSGKRIRKDTNDNSNGLFSQTTELYFYGITGQKLATYRCSYPDGIDMVCAFYAGNVYFGSKLVVSDGVGVVTDRLGSVRWNQNGEQFSYYPYGEERTNTIDGRVKFGTYFRDSAGQDYADQRYYGATTGRFWSADPSSGVSPGNPSSWNRYAYVLGDPINFYDPHGKVACYGGEATSTFNGQSTGGGTQYWSDCDLAISPGGDLMIAYVVNKDEPSETVPDYTGSADRPYFELHPCDRGDSTNAGILGFMDKYKADAQELSNGTGTPWEWILAVGAEESAYGGSTISGAGGNNFFGLHVGGQSDTSRYLFQISTMPTTEDGWMATFAPATGFLDSGYNFMILEKPFITGATGVNAFASAIHQHGYGTTNPDFVSLLTNVVGLIKAREDCPSGK